MEKTKKRPSLGAHGKGEGAYILYCKFAYRELDFKILGWLALMLQKMREQPE